MKTKYRDIFLLLSVLAALIVPAFADKDISGRWTAPFNREGTPVTLVMNLKVSGSDVSGTMTTARGKEMTIENGKLDGDKLTFDCNIEGPGGRKFHLHYVGTVVEDSIKMQGEANDQPQGQTLNFHRSEQ